MPFFLGLALLVLLVWVVRGYSRAQPATIVKRSKTAAGVAALGGAGLLALRGQLALAATLAFTGVGLLGIKTMPNAPWNWGRRSEGQVSRVRTALLEMELDHDSGRMSGRFLAGPHTGRALDSFDRDALLEAGRAADIESRALLEAYLDRRFPGWREDVEADAGPRSRGSAKQAGMTQEEAYEVLGLQPGADADEIRRAHRTLMKKLHPDQGGSTYLAARVNMAKEVLLGTHRD